jgi:hypothetical protein
MDWHDYITGELVEARLAERRAEAARERILLAQQERQPLRVTVGSALIRLGGWIVGANRATRLKTSVRRA